MFSDDFMSEKSGEEIQTAVKRMLSKAGDIARGEAEYMSYEDVFESDM